MTDCVTCTDSSTPGLAQQRYRAEGGGCPARGSQTRLHGREGAKKSPEAPTAGGRQQPRCLPQSEPLFRLVAPKFLSEPALKPSLTQEPPRSFFCCFLPQSSQQGPAEGPGATAFARSPPPDPPRPPWPAGLRQGAQGRARAAESKRNRRYESQSASRLLRGSPRPGPNRVTAAVGVAPSYPAARWPPPRAVVAPRSVVWPAAAGPRRDGGGCCCRTAASCGWRPPAAPQRSPGPAGR